MLPLKERVFLYTYLSRVLSAGLSAKEALQYYCQDNVLKSKHAQALKQALNLFKKNKNLPLSLFIAKIIPQNEYLILKADVWQKTPLIKIFLALADNLTKQSFLRTKIKTVMIYPTILIMELFVILGLAIFWLAPRMQIFFMKLKIPAPALLKFFYFLEQNLSGLWRAENFVWLIIGPSFIWLIYQVTRLEKIKYHFDNIYLRLPKIGYINKLISLQNIFNYLSLMAGRHRQKEIHQALKTISVTTKNLAYKKTIYNLALHLQKGGTLKQFWQKKQNRILFPVLVRRLLVLGERSGNYSKDIRTLSKILTQELDIKLKHFIAILEPVLIISIAGLVAALALTMQNIVSQIQR
jgi:type II secretory pathway component PulF